MDRKVSKSAGKQKATAKELSPGQGRRDLRKWTQQFEQMAATDGGQLSEFERMLGLEDPVVGVSDQRYAARQNMMTAIVTMPAPLMVVVPSPAPMMVVVATAGVGS